MKKLLVAGLISAGFLVGCGASTTPVDDRNSAMTQGNVQMNVAVGKTTKTEILEVFGAPNITTRDSSGQETWTYQRSGQVAQSNSETGYWNIIFAGQAYSNSGFASNSRMMTLIIKFNSKDVVTDFSSRTSNF